MAYASRLIQTITVTTGGSVAIEFTSIPQTYKDLMLLISARSTSALDTSGVAFDMTINGVTTNRTARRIYGLSSSAGADAPATPRFGAAIPTSTATASTFGNLWAYFANYSGSTYKNYSVDSVAENNSTTLWESDMSTGLWSTTDAITTIKFTLSNGNFAEFSSASLYGIVNS